jgi:hypothetical protein
VPAAEPKIVGLSSPEVLVLVHAFSDKENTKAESSKNKDFCIRFIRGFVYSLRREKTRNPSIQSTHSSIQCFLLGYLLFAKVTPEKPKTENG